MLSFCRSGLLALTLVSGSMAVQAQTQRISHEAWFSDVSIERLQDKSVLTEYFGEGVSKEHKDVVFRVGFIPRFGCAPLITVKIGNDAVGDDGAGASAVLNPSNFPPNLGAIGVWIDDTSLSFPALLDKDSTSRSIYLNTNLQRRLTARLRVEIGNQMRVELRTGDRLTFSLKGSRDAISIANQDCRRHDPSVQG